MLPRPPACQKDFFDKLTGQSLFPRGWPVPSCPESLIFWFLANTISKKYLSCSPFHSNSRLHENYHHFLLIAQKPATDSPVAGSRLSKNLGELERAEALSNKKSSSATCAVARLLALGKQVALRPAKLNQRFRFAASRGYFIAGKSHFPERK